VPDEIVIGIIEEGVAQPDCAMGAVFDGFPRTIAQAQALDDMLAKRKQRTDAVIELRVGDEALIGRMEQRIKENPGAARADDKPETLRNRLEVYHMQTASLLDYYAQQKKLYTVDGMARIEQVTAAIRAVIEGLKVRQKSLFSLLFGG
jgi:adenylate kinase